MRDDPHVQSSRAIATPRDVFVYFADTDSNLKASHYALSRWCACVVHYY